MAKPNRTVLQYVRENKLDKAELKYKSDSIPKSDKRGPKEVLSIFRKKRGV